MENQNKLPGAASLLSSTLDYYSMHWKTIAGISAVPAVLGLAAAFFGPIAALVLGIGSVIVSIFSRLALYASITNNLESVGLSYRAGLRYFIPFIWLSILSSLVVFGGFLLLIVPGIILAVLIGFSPYVLFSDNSRGFSAIAQSWFYVRGLWWGVAWRFLFLGLAALLIIIAFSILLSVLGLASEQPALYGGTQTVESSQAVNSILSNLIFLPITTIYGFLLFQALKNLKGAPAEAEIGAIRKKLTIFSILGVLSFILFFAFFAYLIFQFAPLLIGGVKS